MPPKTAQNDLIGYPARDVSALRNITDRLREIHSRHRISSANPELSIASCTITPARSYDDHAAGGIKGKRGDQF
jgi:hypothetical protein